VTPAAGQPDQSPQQRSQRHHPLIAVSQASPARGSGQAGVLQNQQQDGADSDELDTVADSGDGMVPLSWQTFGGPAGHIAVMQRTLVEQKRWIGQRRFLHALNYCMLPSCLSTCHPRPAVTKDGNRDQRRVATV
jgi:hypothetical protein